MALYPYPYFVVNEKMEIAAVFLQPRVQHWDQTERLALTVSLYLSIGTDAADDGHGRDQDSDHHRDYPQSLHVGLRTSGTEPSRANISQDVQKLDRSQLERPELHASLPQGGRFFNIQQVERLKTREMFREAQTSWVFK